MTAKKRTGRIKSFSLKSTPEFHQNLKIWAAQENCLMIEILEQAVAVWEKQRQKELTKPEAKKVNIQSVVLQAATPSPNKKRQLEDKGAEKQNGGSKKRKTDV